MTIFVFVCHQTCLSLDSKGRLQKSRSKDIESSTKGADEDFESYERSSEDFEPYKGEDFESYKGKDFESSEGEDLESSEGEDLESSEGEDLDPSEGEDVEPSKGEDVESP